MLVKLSEVIKSFRNLKSHSVANDTVSILITHTICFGLVCTNHTILATDFTYDLYYRHEEGSIQLACVLAYSISGTR